MGLNLGGSAVIGRATWAEHVPPPPSGGRGGGGGRLRGQHVLYQTCIGLQQHHSKDAARQA